MKGLIQAAQFRDVAAGQFVVYMQPWRGRFQHRAAEKCFDPAALDHALDQLAHLGFGLRPIHAADSA